MQCEDAGWSSKLTTDENEEAVDLDSLGAWLIPSNVVRIWLGSIIMYEPQDVGNVVQAGRLKCAY